MARKGKKIAKQMNVTNRKMEPHVINDQWMKGVDEAPQNAKNSKAKFLEVFIKKINIKMFSISQNIKNGVTMLPACIVNNLWGSID